MKAMRNKYGAKKVIDPFTKEVFDSKKEYNRYLELMLKQQAGEISDLRRQVDFELLPAVYEIVERIDRNGHTRKVRRCVERGVHYRADFVYMEDGRQVVEDVKGLHTSEYILKRKMLLHFNGIRISEV